MKRFAWLGCLLVLGCGPSAGPSLEPVRATESATRVPVAPSDPGPKRPVFRELTAEENAEMDALPPPIVGPYGFVKPHSGGCSAGLEWTGTPSVTSQDPFIVRAVRLKPGVSATLFYGDLAVKPAGGEAGEWVGGNVHRLEPQVSGGSGPCDGSTAFDLGPLLRSGTDPFLVGAKVFCQVEFRDDGDPAGSVTAYTYALQLIVQP